MNQFEKYGVDHTAVNTEMNKMYYLTDVLNTCKDRLELLLKGNFTHKFKYEFNMAQKQLRRALNNSEKLYKKNVDAFEDGAEFLDEILDLCMYLDTDEKKLRAISNLKLIIKK